MTPESCSVLNKCGQYQSATFKNLTKSLGNRV
jgi:hypothetical protein